MSSEIKILKQWNIEYHRFYFDLQKYIGLTTTRVTQHTTQNSDTTHGIINVYDKLHTCNTETNILDVTSHQICTVLKEYGSRIKEVISYN